MGKELRNFNTENIITYTDSLKSQINTLEDYNNYQFWNQIKEITIQGNNNNNTKERITKMTPREFKTYFIKTSYKLLEKQKEKTIKNSTQQTLYNNDSQTLTKQIRTAINENINTHTYNKKTPFNFTMTFPYYFKKALAQYTVTLKIITEDYSPNIRYFKNLTQTTIQCKKLNININLTEYPISTITPFYNLYQELITKQRKTYLDKIAIELTDNIRYVLDRQTNES